MSRNLICKPGRRPAQVSPNITNAFVRYAVSVELILHQLHEIVFSIVAGIDCASKKKAMDRNRE